MVETGDFSILKDQVSSAFGYYSLFHLIVWILESFENGFFGKSRLTDAVSGEKELILNSGICPEAKFPDFLEAV